MILSQKINSKKNILLVIAFLSFFLIYTHQIFWSPIHGDGAVYSHLMKEFSETGQLHWRKTITDGPGETGTFYDHPYFFFVYSFPFIKTFGASDWAVKIPNIVVALFSIWLVFILAGKGLAGISAAYFLALNPTYELQTREPMLDPLAQALALAAVAWMHLRRNYFGAGLMLGLAFLTKGLELLPNLAAVFIFMLLIQIELNKSSPLEQKKAIMKSILQAIAGFCIPLVIWFGWDVFLNHGHWAQGYFDRQFAGRFFNASNKSKPMTWDFVRELLNIFEPQFLLLVVGSLWMWSTKRKFNLLWYFNFIYIFITCVAFTLIKKVALQHYTGIFLSTSVVLGMITQEFFNSRAEVWQNRLTKISNFFIGFIFISIFAASLYFWTTPFNKKDLWGNIISSKPTMSLHPDIPVLIDPGVYDFYGLFYTAQWYWPNPIYSLVEKGLVLDRIQKQGSQVKEVFVVRGMNASEFTIERIKVE